jgi:hemolysin activation/secretion protein
MRSFQAIFGLNAQENTSRGQEGWSIYTSAEFASKMSGGQFSFNQYVVDIRRYQPLGFNSNLNIRVRGGTSEKSVPLQKQFEIGGIGTLPAYPYKYRSGSRMILANAELIVGTGFFKDADFWLLDVLDSFTWITFSDAGWVSDDTQSQVPYNKWNKGFEKINWDDFAHNFGVGIANRSGSFRFGYAWRTTDRTGGLWFLRITRPF